MEAPGLPLTNEPGSFRDHDSRVVLAGDRVLRLLSTAGLAEWRAVAASPVFAALVDEGKVVATSEIDGREALPGALADRAAAVLEHEIVPFVSYPYEWSFAMLRDAALLQLELVRRCVEEGLTLQDASPYNVQFSGTRPLFVDIGSFRRLADGEAWLGYRQFCTLFLYPLLLEAWKGVPFRPWLRGSLDGISPAECRSMLSMRDFVRRGALTHVVLHSRLERRYATSARDVRQELKSAGFRRELILANVRGLERLVSRLRRARSDSSWSDYGPTTTYSEDDAERKRRFVGRALAAERPRLVWDIGANDGRHSRLAAETAEYVVAMDADAVVVDRLYEQLRTEGSSRILPLVVDIADPSPGLGWRAVERRPLVERGRPDLTLSLALVHHVSVGANVPIESFLDWLRELGSVVVEFPTPEDPMVQRLLARKRPGDHPDYRRDWFERCLEQRFHVDESEPLGSGTRILYHARPRA